MHHAEFQSFFSFLSASILFICGSFLQFVRFFPNMIALTAQTAKIHAGGRRDTGKRLALCESSATGSCTREIATKIWSFEPRISQMDTDKKGLDRNFRSDFHYGVSNNGGIQPNPRSLSVIICEIRGRKSC
jgi:hypothetical protein